MSPSVLFALLVAFLTYLPFGYAAVIEERAEAAALALLYRPGDHRQWKQWVP